MNIAPSLLDAKTATGAYQLNSKSAGKSGTDNLCETTDRQIEVAVFRRMLRRVS